MAKQRYAKFSYSLSLKFILIAQIIFIPSPGLGQTQLRPSAAANSHPADIGQLGLQTKSSLAGKILANGDKTRLPTGMDKRFGDGTSPEKIVTGKAAEVSPYSASEIIRSIQLNDIPAENHKLDEIMGEIINEIKQEHPEGSELGSILLGRVGMYHRKVRRYFTECYLRTEKQKGLIKDSISMLEFLISHDLEGAFQFDDTEEKIILITIKKKIEKRTTYGKPLVKLADHREWTEEEKHLIEQRAREEWQRFIETEEDMISMYSELEKEQEAKIGQLNRKIEGLKGRNGKLGEKKKATEAHPEKVAITQRIRKNKESIRRMKEDIEASSKTKVFYNIYQRCIREDIRGRKIKGWENLAKQNRGVSDILYNDVCKELERLRGKQDQSTRAGKTMYEKLTEQLRLIEDFIGHFHGIDPFYLKAPAEKVDLILFTDKEIGTPSLFKLISKYKIRGIISAEGTIGSHWTIVASQKKIPAVILKGLKEKGEKIKDIVRLGDDIILETSKKEGKSTVVIRPDDMVRYKYYLAAREQELYRDLCKDGILDPEIRSRGIPIFIYGNAVAKDDAKDILKEGGSGMGLVRTEVDLARHAHILKSYIQDCIADNNNILQSPHRDIFLLEHRKTILEYLNLFKEQPGPVTIRTFDIKWDKNKDVVLEMPDEQRKEGFDFYKTKIGKNILILQIAAILNALYIAAKEGWQVKPVVIFPMVKAQADMRWIFKKILPEATEEARERIKAEAGRQRLRSREYKCFNRARESVKYGPMIETAEAIDNIETIVSDPQISILSVGTNDLIGAILTRELGFRVSRDDEHLERFFFELRPEVLEAMEKVAKAISEWNKINAKNIKTLGFCGELASREKFLLFVLYLKQRYDIPIYLSMPPESMPIMEYFRSFVTDEGLSIFREDAGFRVEDYAAACVDIIYGRIRSSGAYIENVRNVIERERSFFDIVSGPAPKPTKPPAVIRAISRSA